MNVTRIFHLIFISRSNSTIHIVIELALNIKTPGCVHKVELVGLDCVQKLWQLASRHNTDTNADDKSF